MRFLSFLAISSVSSPASASAANEDVDADEDVDAAGSAGGGARLPPARIREDDGRGKAWPLLVLANHGRGNCDRGGCAAVKEQDNSHGAAKRMNAVDRIISIALVLILISALFVSWLNVSGRGDVRVY